MTYTLILWILFPGQPRLPQPDVTIPGFHLEQTCAKAASIILHETDTGAIVYECVPQSIS